MINIGIVGCEGRMGRTLIAQIGQSATFNLVAAITHDQSPNVGTLCATKGVTDITITNALTKITQKPEVIIDFSTPESTLHTLKAASEIHCPVVIGTTGFSDEQKKQISEYSLHIPILFSANMSIGVNLMYALLEIATKTLGHSADIEIVEMHHRNKVDSPSGTALKMGEVIAHTLQRDLKQHAIFGRVGQDGPRDQKTIGFATLRGGDVIGDHTAIFADVGERIEITHKATDRMTFAQGALRGASWLIEQNAGLYEMKHVLGFE